MVLPDTVLGMVVLALVLIVIAVPLVVGYRQLAKAISPQAARGVLFMMVGVGGLFWLVASL
jgi:hypothetical protein